MCKDGMFLVIETEWHLWMSEQQIDIVERTDRANIRPEPIEYVRTDLAALDALGDNVLAEIWSRDLVQYRVQHLAAEHIDAHRSEVGPLRVVAASERCQDLGIGRLFCPPGDDPVLVGRRDAQRWRLCSRDRLDRNTEIGS